MAEPRGVETLLFCSNIPAINVPFGVKRKRQRKRNSRKATEDDLNCKIRRVDEDEKKDSVSLIPLSNGNSIPSTLEFSHPEENARERRRELRKRRVEEALQGCSVVPYSPANTKFNGPPQDLMFVATTRIPQSLSLGPIGTPEGIPIPSSSTCHQGAPFAVPEASHSSRLPSTSAVPPPRLPSAAIPDSRSALASRLESARLPPTNQQRAAPGKTVVKNNEACHMFVASDMYIRPSVTSSIFRVFDVDFELRVYRHFDKHSSQFELRATLTALHATRPDWCMTVDCTVALINMRTFTNDARAAAYGETAVSLSESCKTWHTQKIIAWEKLCELENEFFLDNKHLVVSLTIVRRPSLENPSSRMQKKVMERKPVVVKPEVKEEVVSEEEGSNGQGEEEGNENEVEQQVEDSNGRRGSEDEEKPSLSVEDSGSVEQLAPCKLEGVFIPYSPKRKWWFSEDGDYSKEVWILVEGRKIRVGRQSLCKYLKCFEHCDDSHFDEGTYEIRGVRYVNFRAFLWLTFWDAPSQLEGRLMILAKLANVFQNDVVKRKCAEFLFERSKTMPPGFLLFAGERYALREVVDRALSELRSFSQVYDVVTGKYYKKLSQELAIEVLKELKNF